jgi:putative endonuclease
MSKLFYIYIVTNQKNNVLYTGVTNDLRVRVLQHRNKTYKGFTSKYNVDKLVYFEVFEEMNNAIHREKQIKAGSRSKKMELITARNPQWNDLFDFV